MSTPNSSIDSHDAEFDSEQAFIWRAHRLLERAQERVAELRKTVDVTTGGTPQAFLDRDAVEASIERQAAQLELGDQSLVFGRIDYQTGGEADGEAGAAAGDRFYIGRVAVSDEEHEVVVVDWRANIAQPFFSATPGDPKGLVRRRHFTTAGEQLQGIEDELFAEGLFADERVTEEAVTQLRARGALVAALTARRSGQMRDAVATIQVEQDEIIRSPLAPIVIVQGGPGTGKTVVALHRAAYLLYENRFPLEDQGVLVIGPNRLFLYYIERVLPSLGASGVRMAVAADLFTELFPRVRLNLIDPPRVAAIKGSPVMASVLARALADRQRPLREPLRLAVNRGYETLSDADAPDDDELDDRLADQQSWQSEPSAARQPSGPVYVTLSPEASRRIIARARRRFGQHNPARAWVRGAVIRELSRSSGDRHSPQELSERLEDDEDLHRALERMWPVLSPIELLRDLLGSQALLRSACRDQLSEQAQERLFRERGELETYAFSDADVPLLDEAFALLGRRPSVHDERDYRDPEVRTYGHLVIDEAQDVTPMALRMLSRRSLNGSMTVVGDFAQSTEPGAPTSWDDVIEHLFREGDRGGEQWSKPPEVVRKHLTLGYRIPASLLTASQGVLRAVEPDLAPPVPVRDAGDPARFSHVANFDDLPQAAVDAVRELTERDATVLVVAPSTIVDEVEVALRRADVDFGRPTPGSRNLVSALHPRVTLAAVSLVKGLEADAVIIVEPTDLVDEEPRGLRALYVALTRATRHLVVLHSQPLPSALTRDSQTR